MGRKPDILIKRAGLIGQSLKTLTTIAISIVSVKLASGVKIVQVINHLRGDGTKMPNWMKKFAIGYEGPADEQLVTEEPIKESPGKPLGIVSSDPIKNNTLARSDLTRRFVISIISGVGLAIGFSIGYAVIKIFTGEKRNA
jgi:hypothetical protein